VKFVNASLRTTHTWSDVAKNRDVAKSGDLIKIARNSIAVRDKERAVLEKADASHVALQQFRDANLKLDAYAAACEAEAATNKALSAAKKAEAAVEQAGPGGATETKHLAKFRAFVTKEALTPPTQYAKSGWMQEWYAEAFSLWRADPAFLEDQYPKLKKWFDDGEHLKD
jgi:hypothetical protein